MNGERQDFVVPNTVVRKDGGYVENSVPVTHQNYWERIGSTGNYGLPEVFTYDATNIRLRNITFRIYVQQSDAEKDAVPAFESVCYLQQCMDDPLQFARY